MANFLSTLLVICAALTAIPVAIVFLEILFAVRAPIRESSLPRSERKRIAVVVPAHNESSGLLPTLEDIKAQLHTGDRLLVVADNCTDDTAAVAGIAGAEVTNRHDLTNIGKGYALAWGVRHLNVDPPEVVIFIDADCRVAKDTLDHLAIACATARRPVQALDLMTASEDSHHRVAAFAFLVKNWVRPLGLRALKLPCQLMGTGMALPWRLASSANLASGLGVEDLELGLDLTRAGYPPIFCPSASVTSAFPSSVEGAASQRKRWEQGHLSLIIRTVPSLILESLLKRNFALLALAMDAAVPPLTLLGMLIMVMVVVSAVGVLVGLSPSGLVISAANLTVYLISILICWRQFGRNTLPLNSFGAVVLHICAKLPLYRQFFSRDGTPQWIRTDRSKTDRNVN